MTAERDTKNPLYWVGATALAGAAVYAGSMKWLAVREETICENSIPLHLDGLRILHISDLHGNSKNKMNVNIWETIERQSFDMVFITGDLASQRLSDVEPHLPEIKKLAERAPVFFVDGNHEMYFYEEMKELLTVSGVHVLENEHIECNIAGFGLVNLIGTRDYLSLRSNRMLGQGAGSIGELFAQRRGEFTLVLSHEPRIFDIINRYENLIVFCGHTHGGQVRLPFFPTLYASGQGVLPKYGKGFYRHFSSRMYISGGIGNSVLPLRFFNRPEISIVTLKSR